MVDENDLETESSPVSDEEGVAAESPPAVDETEDELLAVVQSAVEGTDPEEPASSAESDEEIADEVVPEAVAEESDTEPSDDEGNYDDVPFNQHPRFQELIAEKNELKPLADNYVQITNYLAENNISSDEAAEGFQIMALIKNNPVEARKALQPWIDELDLHAGNRFPSDIQEKIDQGYIDEASAADMTRMRMAAEVAEGKRQMTEDQLAQAQQAQHVNSLAEVVTEWENGKLETDPDYELKQEEMDDRVKALISEFGQPQDADQAIQLVEAAYETVNARFAARRPQKKAVRTASGGKPAGNPAAQPERVLEVIQQTLASS